MIKGIVKNSFYGLYFILIFTISWGRFWTERGYHAEQHFFLRSLYEPGLKGFFFPDSSRLFMSTLYHLGYKLTSGSFLGIHLMFGLTVILTSFFTILILIQLGVKNKSILVLVAGLTSINAADLSMNVPSMIIVKQSVVAALASIALVLYISSRERINFKELLLIFLLFFAQTFSLWSYEAGIGLILGGMFLLNFKKINFRFSIVYLIVPIIFLANLFVRYIHKSEVSYQSQKLTFSGVSQISERYQTYLANLINPMKWIQHWENYVANCSDSFNSFVTPYAISILVMTIFIGYLWINEADKSNVVIFNYKGFLNIMLLVLLCYLPFVFVVDGAGSWRTHFYAIPGFGLLIGMGLSSVTQIKNIKIRLVSIVLSVFLICLYTFSGTYASLASQVEMNYRWNANREISLQFLNDFSQVRDHTLVILLDYPNQYSNTICKDEKNVDNFGDAYWFTAALKMIYPYSDIRGVYLDENGSPKSSGAELVFVDGYMGFSDIPKMYGLQDLIVYKWNGESVILVKSLPQNYLRIGGEKITTGVYDPKKLETQKIAPKKIIKNFSYEVSFLP